MHTSLEIDFQHLAVRDLAPEGFFSPIKFIPFKSELEKESYHFRS